MEIMNYALLELAIEVIVSLLKTKKKKDHARETIYSWFGLTANGMTPEAEKEILESTKKDGYYFDHIFRRTELRKGQNLVTFMDWAKEKNVYFVNDQEFDELYEQYLDSLT